MKNMKLTLLFFAILLSSNVFAQTKQYSDSLSKVLNTLYADLPNNCKNLYGKEIGKSKNQYKSKVVLPNSKNNRFDVLIFEEYPLIFMGYVRADNNKAKALVQLNNISKAILATTIKYKNKSYKIIYLEAESKTGEMPAYEYKLENAPQELENVRIYIRKDTTYLGEPYKYQFVMGISKRL
jgi:hypothetical protein